MRAVDTSVLARYYLRDDAGQAGVAAGILSAGDVFVPKTVLLELAWVLRSVAEQPAQRVLDCIEHLLALPGVHVEDHDQAQAAIRAARRGMDFADSLHLAASHRCTELLTFDDRGYARKARRLGLTPRVTLARG